MEILEPVTKIGFELTISSWFLQRTTGSQDPSPTCFKHGWSHFYRTAQQSTAQFMQTYWSCWVSMFSLQKKTQYFTSHAHLPVRDRNSPQIGDRLGCGATEEVARERGGVHTTCKGLCPSSKVPGVRPGPADCYGQRNTLTSSRKATFQNPSVSPWSESPWRPLATGPNQEPTWCGCFSFLSGRKGKSTAFCLQSC